MCAYHLTWSDYWCFFSDTCVRPKILAVLSYCRVSICISSWLAVAHPVVIRRRPHWLIPKSFWHQLTPDVEMFSDSRWDLSDISVR